MINDLEASQMNAIEEAISFFDNADNVFTTANLQSVMRRHGLIMTGEEIAKWLHPNRRVVRLSGGCHYFLLPGHYERYE